MNHIGGVMVSVLAPSVVDRRFEPQSGQTKDCNIDIYCFSDKHAALRRKSKDWTGSCLGIRLMCPSGPRCPSAGCCSSEVALYKSNSMCVDLV